jgi:beta-N-acetylhexosaminidase
MKLRISHLLALMLISGAFSVIQAQSIADKVGQMLLVGYANTGTSMDVLYEDIHDRNLGGILHFGYNITSRNQIRDRNKEFQDLATTPLFLATDQEGGRVARLSATNGFSNTNSAYTTGILWGRVDSTRSQAARMAGWFVDIGMNVNFAPVVDVNVNPSNPVIAGLQRSYSANPELVYHHASAFISEFQNRNVATSLKHFPGHGSSRADSHDGFTDITDTWKSYELVPYLRLIENNPPDMVMTGHLYHASFDTEYPATLSYSTLTGLLRDSLNYDGIIISDEMFMGALSLNYTFDESVIKAIEAGVDILLFNYNLCRTNVRCGQQTSGSLVQYVIDLVERKISEGVISEARIDESYHRIMSLKEAMYPTDIETTEIPVATTLHQNYPNPFNPQTTIRFDMTAVGTAQIAVYNSLGQQVAILADQTFNAGSHAVNFDASGLASGVYLYTLRTETGIQTRRMTLVK